MSSRHSNSLVSLFIVVSVVMLYDGAPSARAGDKIDFSAPSAPLSVPQIERENKDANASEHISLLPDREPAQISDVPPAQETVVIVPQTKRQGHSWESESTSRDPFEADKAELDPYANARENLGATNRWDMRKGWEATPPDIFQRNEDGERADSLRARLDPLNPASNRDRDPLAVDRFSRDSRDLDTDSAWSRSPYNHAISLDRIRTGQFVPFDGEEKSVLDPRATETTTSVPEPAPGYNYATTAPGMAQYNSQLDTLHGKVPDERVTLSRSYHSESRSRQAQGYGSYSQADTTPESRGMAPTRPAILQFPKKPGDLLR
jgi:hypothetical protein